jgi:hypothetical protein
MEHVDEGWRKSSYSGSNGGACLEAGNRPDTVLVRDSKLGDLSPVLAFTTDAWRTFAEQVKQQ